MSLSGGISQGESIESRDHSGYLRKEGFNEGNWVSAKLLEGLKEQAPA